MFQRITLPLFHSQRKIQHIVISKSPCPVLVLCPVSLNTNVWQAEVHSDNDRPGLKLKSERRRGQVWGGGGSHNCRNLFWIYWFQFHTSSLLMPAVSLRSSLLRRSCVPLGFSTPLQPAAELLPNSSNSCCFWTRSLLRLFSVQLALYFVITLLLLLFSSWSTILSLILALFCLLFSGATGVFMFSILFQQGTESWKNPVLQQLQLKLGSVWTLSEAGWGVIFFLKWGEGQREGV